MDKESLRGLDLVLKATGANEGSAHVVALLDQLCMILPPDDVEGWSTVFHYLGQQPQHSGMRRFDIILGIQQCLAGGVGIGQMEPIWMKTISHAAIHPVSLVLCDWRHPNSVRRRFFHRYRFEREAIGGIRLYPRLHRKSGSRDVIWCMEIPKNVVLSNVLSNLPVRIGELFPGTVTKIGDAWNVPYLLLQGMSNLTAIGTDHVALENMDLSRAGRPVSIGDRTQIGGKLKVWNVTHPNGTGQRKFHPAGQFQTDLGLRFNERDCGYSINSLRNSRRSFNEPIILPEAWHHLMYR